LDEKLSKFYYTYKKKLNYIIIFFCKNWILKLLLIHKL
jgi:hypothetical protein